MNSFELGLNKYLSTEILTKIANVTVGIAGTGGIGSNCAVNLVRSGFKKLVIVDFDSVESSNLNRQFFFLNQVGMSKVSALTTNLLRINPDLKLATYHDRITERNVTQIFKDCQVVVEALDQPHDKQMLIEACLDSKKLVVAASGLAGWGDADEIITRKLGENFYLVGDLGEAASAEYPPLSPRVNLVAAKQANLVLKWVIEEYQNEA